MIYSSTVVPVYVFETMSVTEPGAYHLIYTACLWGPHVSLALHPQD